MMLNLVEANLLERAAWTGVQSGLAILTADGFGWLQASPGEMLATAAVAAGLSALKTLAQYRLAALEVS